jgi:Na+-transporting NADH:ubiquinone oxidoreductase subunit F
MGFILSNVLIVSAIGGFLALLLVLAEMWLAKLRRVRHRHQRGRRRTEGEGWRAPAGRPGRAAPVHSFCLRGARQLRLLQGEGAGGSRSLLPTEKPYLNAQELAAGIRLSCQVKVKNDMRIEIPAELFAIREFKARVERIVDYTYDIKGVTFRLLDPPAIDFKAGQYVQLRAPRYGKVRESVARAYSIASPPERTDAIELIIRQVPDGILTTWVHQFLKEGDDVTLTGPFGDFYIRPTDADMFFIAVAAARRPSNPWWSTCKARAASGAWSISSARVPPKTST